MKRSVYLTLLSVALFAAAAVILASELVSKQRTQATARSKIAVSAPGKVDLAAPEVGLTVLFDPDPTLSPSGFGAADPQPSATSLVDAAYRVRISRAPPLL